MSVRSLWCAVGSRIYLWLGFCGCACVTDVSSVVICNFISASNVPVISQPIEPVSDIHKLWDIENVGTESLGMSVEDKKVIDL